MPGARPAGPEGPRFPWRRILLVGFMGSGKSTVGPRLAEALGWGFRDSDVEIESEAGRSIPEIFREEGEAAFREREARTMRALLGEEGVVIASGGGWPCREGRMESAGADTLTIWLRVGAEAAVARAGGSETERPLLRVGDPLSRARELLALREPYYATARWWVDTEHHAPEATVRLVTDRLRADPERPLRV